MKRKKSNQIIATILAFVMLLAMVPVNVFADNNSDAVYAIVQSVVGDSQAKEAVKELKKIGLLNNSEKPVEKESLKINGEDMTLSEVLRLADSMPADEAVNVEDLDTTWGRLKDLLQIRTLIAAGTEKAGANFDPEIVKELQAICGDKYDAETILRQMYNAGLVDEAGNPDLGDTFIVDGVSMTQDELREAAKNNDPNAKVNLDGSDMTWKKVMELFNLKDMMDMINECKNSQTPLSQEHIDNLKSFFTQISQEGINIENKDGDAVVEQPTEPEDVTATDVPTEDTELPRTLSQDAIPSGSYDPNMKLTKEQAVDFYGKLTAASGLKDTYPDAQAFMDTYLEYTVPKETDGYYIRKGFMLDKETLLPLVRQQYCYVTSGVSSVFDNKPIVAYDGPTFTSDNLDQYTMFIEGKWPGIRNMKKTPIDTDSINAGQVELYYVQAQFPDSPYRYHVGAKLTAKKAINMVGGKEMEIAFDWEYAMLEELGYKYTDWYTVFEENKKMISLLDAVERYLQDPENMVPTEEEAALWEKRVNTFVKINKSYSNFTMFFDELYKEKATVARFEKTYKPLIENDKRFKGFIFDEMRKAFFQKRWNGKEHENGFLVCLSGDEETRNYMNTGTIPEGKTEADIVEAAGQWLLEFYDKLVYEEKIKYRTFPPKDTFYFDVKDRLDQMMWGSYKINDKYMNALVQQNILVVNEDWDGWRLNEDITTWKSGSTFPFKQGEWLLAHIKAPYQSNTGRENWNLLVKYVNEMYYFDIKEESVLKTRIYLKDSETTPGKYMLDTDKMPDFLPEFLYLDPNAEYDFPTEQIVTAYPEDLGGAPLKYTTMVSTNRAEVPFVEYMNLKYLEKEQQDKIKDAKFNFEIWASANSYGSNINQGLNARGARGDVLTADKTIKRTRCQKENDTDGAVDGFTNVEFDNALIVRAFLDKPLDVDVTFDMGFEMPLVDKDIPFPLKTMQGESHCGDWNYNGISFPHPPDGTFNRNDYNTSAKISAGSTEAFLWIQSAKTEKPYQETIQNIVINNATIPMAEYEGDSGSRVGGFKLSKDGKTMTKQISYLNTSYNYNNSSIFPDHQSEKKDSPVFIESIKIPDGLFYPGDKIPIRVNFDADFNLNDKLKLVVNGDELVSINTINKIAGDPGYVTNNKTNSVLYEYTVKQRDTGTANVTGIKFDGAELTNGTVMGSGNNVIQLKNGAIWNDFINKNCSLSQNKMDSFSPAKVYFNGETVSVEYDINHLDKDGNPTTNYGDSLDSWQWIAMNASAAPDIDVTSLIDADGNAVTADGFFYLKSMCVDTANEGINEKSPISAVEKLAPFYIVTTDGEVSYEYNGETVTVSEIPTKLIANFKLDENIYDGMFNGRFRIFCDPAIASVKDWKTDDRNDMKFVSMNRYFQSGTFFFDKDKNDVSVKYSDVWKHFVPAESSSNAGTGGASDISEYQDTIEVTGTEQNLSYYANQFYLSYDLSDRSSFSFADPQYFAWESSNESVATVETVDVEGKRLCIITPTGAPGSATFNLIVKNGNPDKEYVVASAAFNFKYSSAPYMKTPAVKKVIRNMELMIPISSSITTYNSFNGVGDTTTFTLNVYGTDGEGNKDASNVVYTKTFESTVDNTLGQVSIPGTVLNKLSSNGKSAYIAEVSALAGETPYTGTTGIEVKAAPGKATLKPLENYYVTDVEPVKVEWDITNINFASGKAKWSFKVIRNSDGQVVKQGSYDGKNYTGDEINKEQTELDLKASLTLTPLDLGSAGLREAYTVQVNACNDEMTDPMTSDSYAVYVYKNSALKLLVNAAGGKTGTTNRFLSDLTKMYVFKDGKFVMDNHPYIEELIETDEKGNKYIPLGTDNVTLEQLQSDVNLQSVISINYGDYVWGMISDQIEWAKDAENDAIWLDYKQAGIFSPIESYKYTSYIPVNDMLLSGIGDGERTITAKHARTGMQDEVTVVSKTLEDQLYLFQVIPKRKATLTYERPMDGSDEIETVNIETDDNGQLALYEPKGILKDVLIQSAGMELVNYGTVQAPLYKNKETGETGSYNPDNASKYETEQTVYTGVMANRRIRSCEQDVALSLTYPLNTIKLRKTSDFEMLILKPDGKPYANGEVTIRGGIYKNGIYCPDAYFSFDGGPVNKNGRDDQTAHTDANGKLKVKVDPTQMFYPGDPSEGSNWIYATDWLEYAFELRFGEYCPKIVKIAARVDDNQMSLSNTEKVELINRKGPANTPYVDSQTYTNQNGTIDLKYSTDNVGPSNRYPSVVINSDTVLWGYDGAVRITDSNDPRYDHWVLPDDMQASAYFCNQDGEQYGGQTNEVEFYPFSSMPIIKSTFTMDYQTLGGVKNGDNYDWSTSMMPCDQIQPAIMTYKSGNRIVKAQSMDYKFLNTISKEEPAQSAGMNAASKDAAGQITDKLDIGSVFGNLVPGGDMLASGMAFFTGMASGGQSTVNLLTFPTEDPSTFKIILSIGEDVTGATDGNYAIDYSAVNDFAAEAEEAMNEDGGDSDDNGEGKVSFSFGGAVTALATYDPVTEKWGIILTGGSISAGVGVEFEYNQNFMVGPVPAFLEITAGAKIGIEFGAQSLVLAGDFSSDFLIKIAADVYVEAFAGAGFDMTILAIKIGIFGRIGAGVTAEFLTTGTSGIYTGQQLRINGEVGIKAEIKILFIKYSTTFASVGFGWTKEFNDYDRINNYWANGGIKPMSVSKMASWSSDDMIVNSWDGTTEEGDKYEATLFGSGQVLYTIENEGVEDRNYMDQYKRVWTDQTSMPKLRSLDETNKLEPIQTNAYPYSNPILTSDGAIMAYVSDAGSKKVEDTVSSYAVFNAETGLYENKGAITNTSQGESRTTFGDTSLAVAGKGTGAFAAWVTTTEVASGTNLSLAMDNSEIMAAKYDGTAWTAERLTVNSTPDLAPAVATNGNKAIAVWRSVASSTGEALEFNTEDYIAYRIYDGATWGTQKVAYNGVNGTVKAMQTAMMSDGTAIIVYTVDCADSTETFYSTVNVSGEVVNTVRLTNDSNADENVQVKTIKQTVGEQTSEQFVLGWYTQDADKDSDIRMAAVKADGLLDANFIESIAGANADRIGSNFRFAASADPTLSDLAIVWTEKTVDDGSENYQDHSLVNAVKFYSNGAMTGVTNAQEVATMPNYNVVDAFDAYTGIDGNVYAAIATSDYSNTPLTNVGTVKLEDVVNAIVGERTEANAAEWDAAMEKAQQEQQANTIKIMNQTPECKMYSATAQFISKFDVNGPTVDQTTIFRGATVPVMFTVMNTGTQTISKVDITLAGKASEYNIELLPAQSQTFVAYHTLGEDLIQDAEYTIKGYTPSGEIYVSTKSGTLALSKPDVGVRNIRVANEKDGKRDIQVTLYNDTDVALASSGKTVKAALYSKSDCTEESLIGTVDTLTAEDMALIDDGAYVYAKSVDLKELMLKQYTQAEIDANGGEVPDTGMMVYAKAWVENTDGSAYTEPSKGNNQTFVMVKGLLTKAGGKQFDITSALEEKIDGGFVVNANIKNNSLNKYLIGNVRVTLFDENGEKITSKMTYDGKPSSGLVIGEEGFLDKAIEFTAAEVGSDKQVYSSKVELALSRAKVNFSMGTLATAAKPYYRTDNVSIGYMIEKPSDPVVENYLFKGWYADRKCTIPFDFDQLFEVDTTIYPKWEIKMGLDIENVTVSGARLTAMTDTDVTLKLTGATFKNAKANDDVTSWFTNIPAGVKAKVKTVADDNMSMVVTLSGTPSKKSSAAVVVAVPIGAVTPKEEPTESMTVVPQRDNAKAKYDIAGTNLVLNQAVQTTTYEGTARSFAIIETNNHEATGYKVEYKKNGAVATPIDAGTYDVVISRAADDDYSEYSATIVGGLVVEQLKIDLAWAGSETRTYDGRASNVTATASNLVSGDECNITVTGGTESGAGTHIATAATLTGKSAMNYVLPETKTVSYTINKSGTETTTTDVSGTYGDTVTLTASVSQKVRTATADNSVTFTYNGQELGKAVLDSNHQASVQYDTSKRILPVGESIVDVRYSGNDNWSDAPIATVKVKVDPKTATLTWTGNETRVYDDKSSNVQATISNLVGNDVCTVTLENGNKQDAGTHTANAITLSDSYYKLPEIPSVEYIISKKPVTVTANAVEKVAKATDPELTYVITGKIDDSDDVIMKLARIAGESVGTYAIVLSEPNPNYSVNYLGNYLTIKAKASDVVTPVTGKISGSITGGDEQTVTALYYKGKLLNVAYGSNFNFTAVEDGIYNLAINHNGKTKLLYVEVKNGAQTPATLTADVSNLTKSVSVVVKGEDAPNIVADNMETAAGASSSLRLEASRAAEATDAIKKLAGEKGLGLNINLSAYADEQQIPTTEGLVKVVIQMPAKVLGREMTVYRMKNGTAEAMTNGIENANADGEYVEIDGINVIVYTKNFDAYSIAYERPEYTISVEQGNGGTITPSTKKVLEGESVTFKITPKSGYRITEVLVDGKSVGKVTSYTFSGVEADGTISAKFNGGTSAGNGGGGYIYLPGNEIIPTPTPNPGEWKNSFSDVNTNDWFYEAVKYTNMNGLMNGTETTIFEPQTNVTRGMFVTVLYRMEGQPETELSSFSDVPADAYYAKAVAWANANGIVYGLSDTEFAPNANITREQMATMVYRYAKAKGYDISVANGISYTDSGSISDYAQDAIIWAAEKGVMSGNPDGTFAPNNGATRAETATVFQRVVENLK